MEWKNVLSDKILVYDSVINRIVSHCDWFDLFALGN